MIKKLSYSEAEKFHKETIKKMIEAMRKHSPSFKKMQPENVEWAYSFELKTTFGETDIREWRIAIDKNIRAHKLMRVDPKLIANVQSTSEIDEKLKDFFSNIVSIQLMIKHGDYSRVEVVKKTSLFESKIKEDMGNFKF